jgi:hypothetical protein
VIPAIGTALPIRPLAAHMEGDMQRDVGTHQAFPASERERASIGALKNWLLAAPADNPFDDQIVRLRVAAAIAAISEDALDRRNSRD